MEEIESKIRKLLALAGNNPNENEAKSALMKARKLMMKHKIREGDLSDRQEQDVVVDVVDYSCTKRRDAWLADLSAVIAERHRCVSFTRHSWGAQVNVIGFIGFREDWKACSTIFCFAAEYAIKETRKKEKELRLGGRTLREIRPLLEAYGEGFVTGLEIGYEAQDAYDNRYALVLNTPEAVKQITLEMGKPKAFRVPKEREFEALLYNQEGMREGRRFLDKTRIEEPS